MVVLGVCAAVLIGLSLGLLGGGGSILTVPTIHYLFGLEAHAEITSSLLIVGVASVAKEATATSLLVIAMNSFVAFGATVGSVALDGRVVGAVLVAAVVGSVLGGRLATHVPSTRLRRWCGWFVLAMAVVILGAELPGLLRG